LGGRGRRWPWQCLDREPGEFGGMLGFTSRTDGDVDTPDNRGGITLHRCGRHAFRPGSSSRPLRPTGSSRSRWPSRSRCSPRAPCLHCRPCYSRQPAAPLRAPQFPGATPPAHQRWGPPLARRCHPRPLVPPLLPLQPAPPAACSHGRTLCHRCPSTSGCMPSGRSRRPQTRQPAMTPAFRRRHPGPDQVRQEPKQDQF